MREKRAKHMILGIDPHKMSHTVNALDPATNTTAAWRDTNAHRADIRRCARTYQLIHRKSPGEPRRV